MATIGEKIIGDIGTALKPAVPWLVAVGAVAAMAFMGWELLKKEAKRNG